MIYEGQILEQAINKMSPDFLNHNKILDNHSSSAQFVEHLEEEDKDPYSLLGVGYQQY